MRLLVTGGSGFLGGYVLDEAQRRGHDVVALARSDTAAAAVAEPRRRAAGRRLRRSGRAPRACSSSARCCALLNLASLGFGHAPAIVAAARAAGLDRAVFVSTTAVTTRLPARSKAVRLDAEQQIRESGLKWTILRPTMIYGAPGDRNLSRLLTLLTRAPVLPVPGGGRHLQQPVHVADVAGAVLSAVERPASAEITYDIAGPEPLSFAELLRACAQAVGSRARFVPVPLAPWSRPRAATSCSPPGRGSGRSNCSGWPKTRRSASRTRPGTWGTRPGRSPRASSPRPAPSD